MADSQVEEVKSKIDIVAYINERVPLKKAGRNYKGLCPFHGEKTPSFFVSPDMQFYKCFGCNASGDVLNFLMNFEGLTFPEALEQLAKRAGIKLTKHQTTATEQNHQHVLEAINLAAEYYHYLLTTHSIGKSALAYLKKRKISNQSIADFKLGYSLESWDGLQKFLINKKHFTKEDLLAAGLIIKSDRGTHYDRFRGRIIFPQLTYAGKIVGFSARSLEKDVKEAKYINSPETDFYHKSEILYGLTQAKKTIRDKQRVILVEGEFDVISSHQIGLKEAVAIKGSSITTEQASYVRRLTHNLVLSLDADSAGQEAIRRGIKTCEDQALNLRVVALVGGKDPDELARTDPDKLKHAINNAESVYSFLINQALNQYDITTGEGKKLVARAVMPDINSIENAVEREFYLNQLSQKLHTSHNSLFEELQKVKRQNLIGPTAANKDKSQRFSRRELIERQLLGLIMQSTSPKTELAQISPEWFSEPHLKKLYQSLDTATKSVHQKSADIVRLLPESIRTLAYDVYTMRTSWLEEDESEIAHSLRQTSSILEQIWAKNKLIEIAKTMSSIAPDSQEIDSLQQEYKRLADMSKRVEAGLEDKASV